MEIKRVFILVLDGAGVGALPDAENYGDVGSNTLGHIALKTSNWQLPNLLSLGLGEIVPQMKLNSLLPRGSFGKMAALSPGKDTTSGHWELAGLVLEKPFPLYPNGFPSGLINAFTEAIGRPVLGNVAASGTEIIEQFGTEHLQSGAPIVYTSADSVFQVAAHKAVVNQELLYDWCRIARNHILVGEHAVGRVIARPFNGASGNFKRTAGRRDFSLIPPGKTVLDLIQEKGDEVWVAGKVKDIFAGRGITRHLPASGNTGVMEAINTGVSSNFNGLFWATLVDFDMIYGHRNDIGGFARELELFDQFLNSLLNNIRNDDLLFITADHGCDPTFHGSNHTREFVPLLAYSHDVKITNLGIRESFADLAATVAEVLNCGTSPAGNSFAGDIFGRRVSQL